MGFNIFDGFLSLEAKAPEVPHNVTRVITEPKFQLNFEPTQIVSLQKRETVNYGLNLKPPEEVVKVKHLMTPEMQNIVDALELHHDSS